MMVSLIKKAATAMSTEKKIGATETRYRLTPEAFMATSSQFLDNIPKVISDDNRTLMGIICTRIMGVLYKKYKNMW